MEKNVSLTPQDFLSMQRKSLSILTAMKNSGTIADMSANDYGFLSDHYFHQQFYGSVDSDYLPSDMGCYYYAEHNVFLREQIEQILPSGVNIFILPLVDVDIPVCYFKSIMRLHTITFLTRFLNKVADLFDVDAQLNWLRSITVQEYRHRLQEHPCFEAVYIKKAPKISVFTLPLTLGDKKVIFECHHPEQEDEVALSVEDEVVTIETEFPYVEEPSLCHNGQMKLFCMETALYNALEQQQVVFDTVVYLGAAPGWHIEVVTKAYPKVQFFGIDPQPIIPIGITVLPWTAEVGNRFSTLRDKKRRVVVVSDIFSDELGREFDIVDEYVSELKQDFTVVAVMEKLFLHHAAPFSPVRKRGVRWNQPWTTGSSAERRSVIFGDDMTVVNMSKSDLDNEINYFRSFVRKRRYEGKCYDCHHTNLVLNQTLSVTGVDLSSDVRLLLDRRQWIHPMFEFLKGVKTYSGMLKKARDRYYKLGGNSIPIKLKRIDGHKMLCLGSTPPVLINDHFVSEDVFYPESKIRQVHCVIKAQTTDFLCGRKIFKPAEYEDSKGVFFFVHELKLYHTDIIGRHKCPRCDRKRMSVRAAFKLGMCVDCDDYCKLGATCKCSSCVELSR